jgi:cytochrome c-type biogenesis protein CcmH
MQHAKPVYAFAALLLLSFSASAIDSFKLPEDPEILARYQSLSEEFRCLVCQNQNLADSNAGLAVDLKLEVIRLLESGRTDEQIRLFLTERYGDFVLYNPPLRASTILLWFGPIAVAFFGVIMVTRRRQYTPKETAEAVKSAEPSNDEYLALLRGENNKQSKD